MKATTLPSVGASKGLGFEDGQRITIACARLPMRC